MIARPVYTDWRDRYEIVAKIGAGGSADVYEAVDLESGGDVALKVVDERGAVAGRVVREVEAARALDHPGIVALLDFFSDGRRSFLVWELVRGQSLAELCGELARRRGGARRGPALRRARLRPRQGRRAPRRQAAERDGRPSRARQGHGLRHRPPGRRRHADRRGRAARHDRLHVARAGGRPPRRPADRRLLGRRAALRAARRPRTRCAAPPPARRSATSSPAASRPSRRCAPTCRASSATSSPPPAAWRAGERPSAAETGEALRALAERLSGGRRLRPQRLLAPLRRLEVVAGRGLGAVLVAAGLAALFTRLPAYPPSWTLPLVVAAAVIWLVVPRVGLAFSLGAAGVPAVQRLHRRPASPTCRSRWSSSSSSGAGRSTACGLLLALLLAPVFGTLLAVCAAAAFGRRRAPLVAAWTALVTYFVVALSAAPRARPSPAIRRPASSPRAWSTAGNPVTLLIAAGRALLSWPCLFQAALWAGLALALAVALRLERLEARLWLWSAAFWRLLHPGPRRARLRVASAGRLARAAPERRRRGRRERRRAGRGRRRRRGAPRCPTAIPSGTRPEGRARRARSERRGAAASVSSGSHLW